MTKYEKTQNRLEQPKRKKLYESICYESILLSSITNIFFLSVRFHLQQQAITTGIVLLVTGITCLILLMANNLQKRIGEYGITVLSKIMGLILASYAVQSILSGISSYFGNA